MAKNGTLHIRVNESVMVRNKEELYEKLNLGAEQIAEGKVIDTDTVMARLSDKYGLQG